jgi:hypothetical protein
VCGCGGGVGCYSPGGVGVVMSEPCVEFKRTVGANLFLTVFRMRFLLQPNWLRFLMGILSGHLAPYTLSPTDLIARRSH